MLAVKGIGNGLGERLLAEMVRQHRGPRHRLQRRPVQARCENESRHHDCFCETREHNRKIDLTCSGASAISNHSRSMLRYPYQRATGQQIEERDQVVIRQMDATG